MAHQIVPDRAALAVAHVKLRTTMSLEAMLDKPNLKAVLIALARGHMQRRERQDIKKLQANDYDSEE